MFNNIRLSYLYYMLFNNCRTLFFDVLYFSQMMRNLEVNCQMDSIEYQWIVLVYLLNKIIRGHLLLSSCLLILIVWLSSSWLLSLSATLGITSSSQGGRQRWDKRGKGEGVSPKESLPFVWRKKPVHWNFFLHLLCQKWRYLITSRSIIC